MLEGDRRDEIELLDLLSAEAHVDEIRKAALGNAGDDPVLQQARLDRALRIRETVRELRRRETELLALNDTALDLVSMHSVREVLDAIVRRARILLGADASYLTLVRRVDDVDGEQLVRVTKRHRSPRLPRPSGDGSGSISTVYRRPASNCRLLAQPLRARSPSRRRGA